MDILENIVSKLRESRITESDESSTLWMAKYKPVYLPRPGSHRHPGSPVEIKKVVFYANGDIQDAEEELEAILPPYSECRVLGKAPSLQACLDDGFELIKPANESTESDEEYNGAIIKKVNGKYEVHDIDGNKHVTVSSPEHARYFIDKNMPYAKKEKEERMNEDSDNQAYQEFIKKCQNNPTWKKANSICSKYGYALAPASYVTDYGSPHLIIREPKDNRYAPEIYYNYAEYGKVNPHFKIQTTAVGALEIEEHTKYIESINAANTMVKELSEIDFTTLYAEESEEE